MGEWEKAIIKTATLCARRAHWAKHWLEQFVAADTDVVANGAFRLFLKCVDSRFYGFTDDVLPRASALRRVFFDSSLDEVRRAITSNEKDLREQFLGQKVLDGQVWPWFDQ
jgi:hypothetical protein